MTMPHSKRPMRVRTREKGIALVAVAALATLLSFAGFAAYYAASTLTQSSSRLGQDQLLAQADAIVEAFASTHARLPCPAAHRGGAEDCASGRQKGFFPADVAGAYASSPLSGDVIGLRYLATPRLMKVADVFPADPTNFAHISNGHDLCRELAALQSGLGGIDGGLPADEISAGMDVYGLAAPGAAGFTGANTDADAHLESPGQERTPTYTERVQMRKVRGLARSESCATQINALNVLTMAHAWNDEMPAVRESAVAHFTELTLWPQINSLATWEHAGLRVFKKQFEQREKVVEGITAAAAKDAALCALLYIPACVAAGIQEGAATKASMEAISAAREEAVFITRIAQANANLIQASVRLARYQAIDLWQEQKTVLEAVDRRGPQINVVPSL
ncbi:hypothetical protein [Pseudacidovorax sp.]|jgi:hypothetical protein|uniref:hypothetical protein n=1 Tax=Pseudacidovorax sp. TaxID=1934311 RepID=UPI0025D12602|nr:hypothetical protein [Pseudacidovorax sp.]